MNRLLLLILLTSFIQSFGQVPDINSLTKKIED